MYKFDLTPLIYLGLIVGLGVWGLWELIDLFFIDDAIKVSVPLIPEIELRVIDNQIDTLYVYRAP